MASYGSLHHNIESCDDRPSATERCPLLPNPNGIGYLSASPSRRVIEEDRVTINDILEEEAGALLPLLTKSTTPLGIEVEPIPALAIEPDENGDLRLPRDDTLRYTAKDDDEETGEVRFHGGISTYQFWMIFAGGLSVCTGMSRF
jgi:hypothetical protein